MSFYPKLDAHLIENGWVTRYLSITHHTWWKHGERFHWFKSAPRLYRTNTRGTVTDLPTTVLPNPSTEYETLNTNQRIT
jgi:hypothetical protein